MSNLEHLKQIQNFTEHSSQHIKNKIAEILPIENNFRKPAIKEDLYI